jgi:hypothetical protein
MNCPNKDIISPCAICASLSHEWMACTISQCFLCGSTNHSFTACTEREDLLVTISKTGRVGGYGRVWVMDKGPRRATPSLMPQSWHSRGHVKSKAFYDSRDVLPTAEVFDECCCSVCGLELISRENENVKEENRIVPLMPCLCSEKEGSIVKDLATVQCAACGEKGHAFCARPVIRGTERRKRAIEAKERDAKRLKEEAEADADEDVESGGTTRRCPVLVPLRHVYNGGCIEDPSILKEVAAVIGKNEDENGSQEEEDDEEEEWGSCFNCGGSGHSGSHCKSSKLEAFGAVGPHMDMELRGNEYYSSVASGYSGGGLVRREMSYGGSSGGGTIGYDETRERDRAREKGRSSEWVNFGDDVEGGSRNSSHSSSRFSRHESSSSGQSITSVPLPPGMPVAQRQQQIQSLVNDFERQWKDKSVLKYPSASTQPPQQYPHQIVQQHYQQNYQQNYQQQQQQQPPQQRIVIQRSWEQQPQILQQQHQQHQQQQQNNYQRFANPFLQQTTTTPFLEYQNEEGSSSGPAAKKGRKNRWKDV